MQRPSREQPRVREVVELKFIRLLIVMLSFGTLRLVQLIYEQRLPYGRSLAPMLYLTGRRRSKVQIALLLLPSCAEDYVRSVPLSHPTVMCDEGHIPVLVHLLFGRPRTHEQTWILEHTLDRRAHTAVSGSL